MTKQEKEKLLKFRKWLVDRTERYQELACQPNASNCGRHYDRGNASGFIQARAKLEDLFNLWD